MVDTKKKIDEIRDWLENSRTWEWHQLFYRCEVKNNIEYLLSEIDRLNSKLNIYEIGKLANSDGTPYEKSSR